jgi:hypothetical protein
VIETRSTDVRGWLVVTRTAEDELERVALRREADLLGRARHPGVVELVRVNGDAGEVVTAAPTRATLADLPQRTGDVLRVLAAACETLADLHALGLVHGSIGPAAVLVAPGRAPVLDDFARGGLAGELGPDGEVLRPTNDVAALAELVHHVRTAAPTRRRRALRHRAPADDLDGLLEEVAAGCPPPARRLARAIAGEVALHPDAPSPTGLRTAAARAVTRAAAPVGATDPIADPFARLRPTAVDVSGRRGPRVLTLAAAVAGLTAITAGGLGLWASAAGPSPPRLATTATARTSLPAVSPSTTARTAPTPPPQPTHAPVVVAAHDGILAVGGVRYRIGQPGDEALAADWSCRGAPRVVVLRPGTGEVYVFTGWARPGRDLTATPAGSVPRGAHLRSRTDDAGCAIAVAASPDGTVHPIEISAA